MKLINDQPAVVRADWLEAAVEATGREDLEERRDEHVRLVEERCGGGLEGLVPRRAAAPVASPADGGSR
jgi:hypothetical protein